MIDILSKKQRKKGTPNKKKEEPQAEQIPTLTEDEEEISPIPSDDNSIPNELETNNIELDESNEEQEELDQITFGELGIDSWLENHLAKLDIRLPTVIQEKCIPPTLAGKNVIGMSQTGSGKTATFALPIIQTLAKDLYGICALIITPTRELALQIRSHFTALAGDLPLRVALITGGMDYLKQAQLLDARPHIVVGTPGRIEAAMRLFSNDGYFKRIRYLVFDEADRLLGTQDYTLDMDIILRHVNPNRQTLLYSATMNAQVKKLAKMALQKIDADQLFIYDACRLFTTAENLKQYYLFMPAAVRDCYLVELLQALDKHEICMVFFCSIQQCELSMRTCRLLGTSCDSLHASKSQKDRFRVLEKFRKRRIQVLFATDVGNRGLDIPSVGVVINYDLPDTTDRYVHRVGRTARAGRVGTSISLISQYEVTRVKSIETDTRVKMEKWEKIDEEAAEKRMYEVAEKHVYAKMEMLDCGFAEAFEETKHRQKQTRDLREEAQVFYEMQYMNQLKSGNKWKAKLKSAHQKDFEKEKQEVEQEDQEKPEQKRDQQIKSKSVEIGGINLLGKKRKRKEESNSNKKIKN
jgi:ATP-dependent RNA helicase DDX49/DBP8